MYRMSLHLLSIEADRFIFKVSIDDKAELYDLSLCFNTIAEIVRAHLSNSTYAHLLTRCLAELCAELSHSRASQLIGHAYEAHLYGSTS